MEKVDKGTIYVYGCGGGGTNCVASIMGPLKQLDKDAFSDYVERFIDTTAKTIQAYPQFKESFYRIESNLSSQKELDGLSGERRNPSVIRQLVLGISKYMDDVVKSSSIKDYHVIVFTGSGGSGNTTGSLLYKEMLLKKYNVLPVVIADTSTLLFTDNTIDTIVGLNKIAKTAGVASPIGYFNNSHAGMTSPGSEKQVNKDIEKLLSILGMFVGGAVQDMDHGDMGKFLAPSTYSKFQVESGIYRLTGKVKSLSDANTILARTVVDPTNDELEINVALLHNKKGICNKVHLDTFNVTNFPIFLAIEKDIVSKNIEALLVIREKLSHLKITSSSVLDMLSDSMEDDSGLVN